MSTKPTVLPGWNSGGANNVDPGGTKRALGWVVDEQPSSSTFNFLQKAFSEWVQYLSDGVITAAAAVGWTVTGGTNQDGVVGNGGTGNTNGVVGNGHNSGKGVVGVGGATGLGGTFTGGSSSGAGIRAARGDGSTSDVAAGMVGSIDMTGATDVSKTTAIHNQVTPALLPKAWAHFTGGVSATYDDGANFTSIAATTNLVTCTLARAMLTANYSPVVTVLAGAAANIFYAVVKITSSSVFEIRVYDATGAIQDPTSASPLIALSILVFGNQS